MNERAPYRGCRAFLDSILDGSAPREANGCILWPYFKRQGYATVSINRRKQYVGHLVLERFAGPKPSAAHTMGHAAHDICGNRHCVSPDHLTWQTRSEQRENQRVDGTLRSVRPKTGLEHHHARHTNAEVAEAIRRVWAGETFTAVGQSLGVSRRTVAGWAEGRLRPDVLASIKAGSQ